MAIIIVDLGINELVELKTLQEKKDESNKWNWCLCAKY